MKSVTQKLLFLLQFSQITHWIRNKWDKLHVIMSLSWITTFTTNARPWSSAFVGTGHALEPQAIFAMILQFAKEQQCGWDLWLFLRNFVLGSPCYNHYHLWNTFCIFGQAIVSTDWQTCDHRNHCSACCFETPCHELIEETNDENKKNNRWAATQNTSWQWRRLIVLPCIVKPLHEIACSQPFPWGFTDVQMNFSI